MTGWTTLDYAVADVEGNGQQPPDLVELAILPRQLLPGQISYKLGALVKALSLEPAPKLAPDTRASGFGLAGIAERVASCGGSLTVGPGQAGGFAVTARLPAP